MPRSFISRYLHRCRVQFSTFTRQHHCRACGQVSVQCSHCTSNLSYQSTLSFRFTVNSKQNLSFKLLLYATVPVRYYLLPVLICRYYIFFNFLWIFSYFCSFIHLHSVWKLLCDICICSGVLWQVQWPVLCSTQIWHRKRG